MKVHYRSIFADEEVRPGVPLKTIPGSGILEVIPENGDTKAELFYNGEEIAFEAGEYPADSEAALILRKGQERCVYTAIPFVKSLDSAFTNAYEQFAYEYKIKEKNEIESILNGNIKLYAVDQSTEIRDWSVIFDQLESAYPAFKTICLKPKSHLKAVNEVRPIETVKRVGYESIPYLAAHSEDWLARTASGLKPARLFSRVEDDDYQIYENRVVKTLIDLIVPFLRRTERDLKDKYAQLEGIMNSGVQTGSFGFDVTFKKAIAELVKTDDTANKYRSEAMEKAEKLAKRAKGILKKYISLRNMRLYKELRRAKLVSNPLNETNILLMDKHYSVVFKLWKSLQRLLIPKEQEREKDSTCREDFLNYMQFCKTLIGYASHVLNFDIDSDGNYVRSDNIGISIEEVQNIIEIDIRDIAEHELFVPGGTILPISTGEKYGKFRFDGKKLYWSREVTSDEIEDFAALLKPKGKPGKDQNERRRNYTELKKIIEDREREYPETKRRKVFVIPCVVDLRAETRNSFKEFITDRLGILCEMQKGDLIIAALPKCQEDEQSIVEYAFDSKESVSILPFSMFDINSFRRVQNVLIRQILELKKETCPCCGGSMRKEGEQLVCDYCSGLLLTNTICPEPGCKCSYRYLGYKVSDETIEQMQKVEPNNFFQWDSLYQYKNTVRMKILNKKLITVCPHCGQ